MCKINKQIILSLLILNCFHSISQTKDTLSAIQVVEKSLETMGGIEYLESINTLYTNMSTVMEGRKVNLITKEMKPNKGSFQVVYNGHVVYQNFYDGINGYEFVDGKKVLANQEEFKDKKDRKNIFNELDYIDTNTWFLELIGSEKVEKRDCYKIKATKKSGLITVLYFDKKTFNMLREDLIENYELNRYTSTIYSNFKKFGQLTYYTEFKMGDNGVYTESKIVEVIVNDKVTEEDFK